MRVAVIGTGYVGLVTGTCLAHIGHDVVCVDIDQGKVDQMNAGVIPIYEPGLKEIFEQTKNANKIELTTSLEEAVKEAEVIFLALPTPQGADGTADVSAIEAVADQIGPLLKKYTVIVDKSTVPVGTGEQIISRIAASTKQLFDVVSNPEFLREGRAVSDFMQPDRIVIGTASLRAFEVMRTLYEAIINQSSQVIVMDIRSAEMTKYAANSFLAMKVSFMNEIANLCELVGADVDMIRKGIGPDSRIGKEFLNAGIGYGGSCFPKDVRALQRTSEAYQYDFRLLGSIIAVNSAQKQRLVTKMIDYYGKEGVKDKHFAIWGLAFKPGTDDIRETPAFDTIEGLIDMGATITAYDPEATANMKRYYGDKKEISYAESAVEATKDADALLIVTDWAEFESPNFEALRNNMKHPTIFDGRNVYDPVFMNSISFIYISIGRPETKKDHHVPNICSHTLRAGLGAPDTVTSP
jgi:UDPglucose 6-dehydrogenase